MKRRIFVIAVIIIIIVCSIISIPAIYKDAKRRTEARHQIELKQVTYVVSGKVLTEGYKRGRKYQATWRFRRNLRII